MQTNKKKVRKKYIHKHIILAINKINLKLTILYYIQA